MKALWIRVEAHDVDSPDIANFARALGVSNVMALGHAVALAGAIAEHTDDGNIAGLSIEQLEHWARWRGAGGRMGSAIRTHLQAQDGTYRDWTETMGQLVERRQKDRERKQLQKKAREEAREIPRNVHGNSTESSTPFRGSSAATERNGTGRDGTRTAKEHKAETSEGNGAGRSASLRSKSGTATAAPLPPAAQRFLDRFYPVSGRRRSDVEQQLAKLAAGEILTIGKGQYVQAYDVARLEARCADVIAESSTIHDLNAAIAILFAKLGDTKDGSAPGVREAQRLATPDPDASAIDTWIAEHPRDVARITRELAGGGPVDAFAESSIDAQLRARVRQVLASQHAGSAR